MGYNQGPTPGIFYLLSKAHNNHMFLEWKTIHYQHLTRDTIALYRALTKTVMLSGYFACKKTLLAVGFEPTTFRPSFSVLQPFSSLWQQASSCCLPKWALLTCQNQLIIMSEGWSHRPRGRSLRLSPLYNKLIFN